MHSATIDHVRRHAADKAGLPPDAPLERDTGIVQGGLALDSAAVLELLLALERDFKIQLDAQALLEARALRSIGTLADFIDATVRQA